MVQLSSIKVSMSTIEFVRFEAELSNRELMKRVIKALDGSSLKVIGFFETLKVRAAEAKSDFPLRHDWDEFFRDPVNKMNELRAGERPDTLYIAKLPSIWFQDDESRDGLPSEALFRKVMECFGEVRCVDVPVCDPLRSMMTKSGIRTVGFSFGQEILFEGYVQYVEYLSFVRAMDQLRNMKLVKLSGDGKAGQALIKVDFDRTKHLSDKNIRKRRIEREKLQKVENERLVEEERIREEQEAQEKMIKAHRQLRQAHREEKRRLRKLEQRRHNEEHNLDQLIAIEQRRLLMAKRALETRRLLNTLFDRLKTKKRSRIKKEDQPSSSGEEQGECVDLEQQLRQQLLHEREHRMRLALERRMRQNSHRSKAAPSDNDSGEEEEEEYDDDSSSHHRRIGKGMYKRPKR